MKNKESHNSLDDIMHAVNHECADIKQEALKDICKLVDVGYEMTDEAVAAQMRTAEANDLRVVKFADHVYQVAGFKMISHLKQKYEANIDELMNEIDELRDATRRFTSGIQVTYKEMRGWSKIAATLDITIVVLCGILTVLTWVREPVTIGVLAVVVLLALGGLRMWTQWYIHARSDDMGRGLKHEEIDKRLARINERRRSISNEAVFQEVYDARVNEP